MTDTIRYDRGADGIVTLTLDDPTQSANTMNRAYAASMSAVLDRLESEREELAGVIVTSAKSTFFAGGDLPEMVRATRADAPALSELLGTIKRDLRRLETLGRPVVAASTARRSAAAWRSRSPATIGSRWTRPAPGSGCPR
ncbi:hypothetical protein GCM10027614_42530 [Micromonospora vulcania]